MSNRSLKTDCVDLLLSLQHGDSFFPSGAVAISAGLETLVNENRVTSAHDVREFLRGQLVERWAVFDRPVIAAVYRAAGDLDVVAKIDSLVEAQTLAKASRKGSSRAGGALLGVHAKLGTKHAAAYQNMVNQSMANGHNIVVLGLVWSGVGISQPVAEVISAHTFSTGLVGAALRLGVIGHIDAQRIFDAARVTLEQILAEEPVDLDRISAFTPEQEIAVMRHETMSYRLFVN